MKNKREYLMPGTKLCFENGICIEIDEIVSSGGTALTYYGKELIEDQESVRVLLKELFPEGERFERDSDGRIVGRDTQAECVYEALIEALYCEQELGNQIAQKNIFGVYPMKQVLQDCDTGNYYGLFYQCPPSITLRKLVAKAGDKLSLWGKLKLTQLLAKLVQNVHEQGRFCHNDISGGNVLIMNNELDLSQADYLDWNVIERELQIGLIDFACAVKLDRRGKAELPDEDEPLRFHTEGFSAPELYDAGARSVTVKADVYSVAACLWYLLTEEVLETEGGYPVLGQREWNRLERYLRKHELYSLSGDVRVAFGKNPSQVPEDLITKIRELLEGGLTESWNRFESMGIFAKELQKIIDRIEESSISDEKLYDRAKSAFLEFRSVRRNKYTIREEMLPMTSSYSGKEKAGEQPISLLDHFLSGESIYAIGDGGAGKTTSMFYAAEKMLKNNQDVIPVYVELNRLPMWRKEVNRTPEEYWLGEDDRPMFLEQYLAGIYYGCPGRLTDRNDLVAGALRAKIEGGYSDGLRYVFFLDGLNETAIKDRQERIAFVKAINWYLQKGTNIQLILTSRYDEALIEKSMIRRVQVIGLTEESVLACLKTEVLHGNFKQEEYEQLMHENRNSELWKCLKLPFFLTMYCDMTDRRKVTSAGEILQRHFQDQRITVDGSFRYSERALGTNKYEEHMFSEGLSEVVARQLIIDLILPWLSYRMIQLGVFSLDKDIAEVNLKHYFEHVYPGWNTTRYEYSFDIEVAMKELETAGVQRVLQYVCETMGILAQHKAGSYFFVHQYYRDYFAAQRFLHMLYGAKRVIDAEKVGTVSGKTSESWLLAAGKQILPESVLKLCGECLGIHHTVPEYKNGQWMIPEQWDPFVDSILDICRYYSKKESIEDESKESRVPFLIKNVMDMLCFTRRYGKRADLSGIDLSGIRIMNRHERYSLQSVIFSHVNEGKGLFADLQETGLKRYILSELKEIPELEHSVWNSDGSCQLTWSKKQVFLYTEMGTRSYVEEHDKVTGEVYPIGSFEDIQFVTYRDDGQIIALLEKEVNEDIYYFPKGLDYEGESTVIELKKYIYFYDKSNGKEYSVQYKPESIKPSTEMDPYDSCRFTWQGDTLIIYQPTQNGELIQSKVRLAEQKLEISYRLLPIQIPAQGDYRLLGTANCILIHYSDVGIIYQVDTGETIKVNLPDRSRVKYVVARKQGGIYFVEYNKSVYSLDTEWNSQAVPEAEVPQYVWNLMKHWDSLRERYTGLTRNVEQTSLRIWRAPVSEKAQVYIYDSKEQVLHQFLMTEEMEMECIGQTFVDTDEQEVYAIGVDERKKRLFVLSHDWIRCYNLITGKREKRISDISMGDYLKNICVSDNHSDESPKQYVIEEAEFAPGLLGLEMKVRFMEKDEIESKNEACFLFFDFEACSVTCHNNDDSSCLVERYEFLVGDVLEGIDRGRREMVCFQNEEDSKRIAKIYSEYSELREKQSQWFQNQLKKIKKTFGFDKTSEKPEILPYILQKNENDWLGMNEHRFVYWNDCHKKNYSFTLCQWLTLERKYDRIHTRNRIYFLEDGFLEVMEDCVCKYYADQKNGEIQKLEMDFSSSCFALMCPGI